MKITIKPFLLVLVALLSFSSSAAQPLIETGPKINTTIPALNLLDQFGNKQQINNIIKEKGAIIVLFRSADWCPFCKRHLLELNEVAHQFTKKGYGIAALSYDSPKTLRMFTQNKKLQFSLLSDQNVASFKALNVVNKDHEPGSRHYGIPYPGVIVVDQNGKVVHKYFFEGYRDRVKFKQLLKDL
jgi:peroxiredoxin